jgi:hypothetical protein
MRGKEATHNETEHNRRKTTSRGMRAQGSTQGGSGEALGKAGGLKVKSESRVGLSELGLRRGAKKKKKREKSFREESRQRIRNEGIGVHGCTRKTNQVVF